MALELVLVHGSRLNSACWGPLREHLPDLEIHAPDLPGHGTRLDEDFDMDSAVAVVTQAVIECAEPPLLVGHSLGGYVALECAARAGEGEIAGLALLGASADPGHPMAAPYKAVGEGVRRGLEVSRLQETLTAADRALLKRTLGEAGEAVVEHGVDVASIPVAWQAVVDHGDLSRLHDVTVPVRVINGQLDQFRLGEQEVLRLRPGTEVVHVPGTHLAPVTHPEGVARALRDFVAEEIEVVQDRLRGARGQHADG